MNCPHCNVYNPDDARFCAACGKATSATEPVSHPHLKAVPEIVGKEIAGRYRIQAKLGEGGMGAVYKAEQISLKRQCAIKLLRPDVAGTPIMLQRFNAEAQAVAKLNHPNTVGIYDFGQDTDGTFFIAMEFVEGKSLREVIHAEAPFPLRRALSIAHQIAASLTDAHGHSIVHRDLKPDNVMLQTRGRQRDVARVLDFGIARIRDEGRATQQAMTQAGDMLGTPQYMAPEQIRGEQIDGRTDVYSLGCMLYEMITARMPFEAPSIMALLTKHLVENAPSPSQRRPELNLPPVIDQLIMGAIAKEPNARPSTMEVFGEQIGQVLASIPGGADTSQASAPMSAIQSIATPTGAPPSYGTPPQQPAFGGYTPAPVAQTAAIANNPYGAPMTPPPPGPAPMTPPIGPPSYGTPQGPYGFQQPPTQAPPPKKHGNTGTIIGIVILVVLLGASAAAFALLKTDDKKDETSENKPDKPDPPDKPDKDKVDKPDKPDKDKVDKPDKVEKDDADDDDKPMSADAKTVIAELEKLKNKICSCADAACVASATANATKLIEAMTSMATKMTDTSAITKMGEITTAMQACAVRIAGGGAGVATPPPRSQQSSNLNADLDRYAERACACRDRVCGTKVLTEMSAWARVNKNNKNGDEERAKKSAIRLAQCLVVSGVDGQVVAAAFQAMAN